MKILWIVNTIFPYPAKQLNIKKCAFGGWLNGLANELKEQKEIELGIATVYNGKEIKKFYDGNFTYYLIPGAPALKYNKKIEKYWKKINQEFKPDLVHLHGTEYAHGLSFIKSCPEVKKITSIQGLTYRYADVYYGNIDYKLINENITVRDILKNDTLYRQKRKFEQRGENEIEIIKKSDAILGRTTWDYANTKAINFNEKYYYSNETLRESFYKHKWNISNIEEHTLFCSQAGYPIKGFHYLVQAIAILREEYKDIKLYVSGHNILDRSTLKNRFKRTGYAKYISKLIKKYNLEEHIIFTGILTEEEMVDRLLKSHVFVLPSAIENSSNSLGEAMLMGMPCVATNTGGTMDILEHKKEGFIYSYTEPAMCAEYISNIFKNDKLGIEMGKKARETALQRHDPEINVTRILEIYKDVIGE